MPSLLGIVLGGVVFSILDSGTYAIWHARRKKTAYELWLKEARKVSVVKSRNLPC